MCVSRGQLKWGGLSSLQCTEQCSPFPATPAANGAIRVGFSSLQNSPWREAGGEAALVSPFTPSQFPSVSSHKSVSFGILSCHPTLCHLLLQILSSSTLPRIPHSFDLPLLFCILHCFSPLLTSHSTRIWLPVTNKPQQEGCEWALSVVTGLD